MGVKIGREGFGLGVGKTPGATLAHRARTALDVTGHPQGTVVCGAPGATRTGGPNSPGRTASKGPSGGPRSLRSTRRRGTEVPPRTAGRGERGKKATRTRVPTWPGATLRGRRRGLQSLLGATGARRTVRFAPLVATLALTLSGPTPTLPPLTSDSHPLGTAVTLRDVTTAEKLLSATLGRTSSGRTEMLLKLTVRPPALA